MEIQLLLFEDDSIHSQKRKIEELTLKYDSIRKGQHARISSLQKEIKELKQELEFLKSHICKNNLFLF